MIKKVLTFTILLALILQTLTGCSASGGGGPATGNEGGGSPSGGGSNPIEKPEEHFRHIYGDWIIVDDKTVRQCVCGEVEEKVPVNDIDGAVTLTADLNESENLSLLKKITMYNAGTIDPISNYDRDIDLIEALNAESLRIDLSIGKGDGGRNYTGDEWLVTGNGDDWKNYSYDFTQLDGIVEMISEKDVLPYMSWCYVPKPLQENPNDLRLGWTNLKQSLPNWKQAWQQVYYNYARHYLEEGLRIGYHEIYNEPDLFGVFMNYDDFRSGLYNDMYVYGAKGILEADPDATIGGPAFAIAESAGNTGFINAVKSNNSPMDFFSFHSYMDGDTWPGELNYVDDLIARDDYFLTTAIHINEFSWLHSQNGGQAGANSAFNTYQAAEKTLSAIMEVVERTDVQWAHWAQFMESTCGDDPYGLIFKNGHVKAAYNAIKMYNDMPVWRYKVTSTAKDDSIRAVCSANESKIGYLLWNTTGTQKKVNLKIDNAMFSGATRRVYRIDRNHGSYRENPKREHLVAEDVGGVDLTDGSVWSGVIPANGVVYVTLNEDGYDDFTAWADRNTSFATDIKTSYYYADRAKTDRVKAGKSSYSHFDRNSWTMYLSQGSYNDAHADASIIVTDLPQKFNLEFKTEGYVRKIDKNSALAFRIDFYDEASGDYTSSVLFHNGIYTDARNADLAPWGTGEKPDKVVEFEGFDFDIDLTKYAPKGWNAKTGKAQISFLMQNTGANTRAAIKLS